MVCLGNICRSPLAEGILLSKLKEKGINWTVDSAGTSSWHIGEPPDSRGIVTAASQGIDISRQRGRQVSPGDLKEFDLIMAMDQSNYNELMKISRNEVERDKIKLILNYVYPGENRPVPDPYYDGSFQQTFGLLEMAADKIIAAHSNSHDRQK